jgi:uncharacterized protein (TIGR02145 family)
MKRQNFVFVQFCTFLLLALISGCKKEIPNVPPALTTAAVTNITANSFTSGGNITSDGGAEVLKRGVCWNTSANPSPVNFKTTDGTGTGNFTSSATGLLPGTTYYLKAYAANSEGFAFGNELTVTTIAIAATIVTTAATNIGSTTVTTGGSISTDGGSAITARGVCWSILSNPSTAGPKTTDGTGPGNFTSTLDGLLPGTTYYLRAYAMNSVATVYGAQISVTTLAVPPTLTTMAVSKITSSTATSGGEISKDGGTAITARGVCWGTTPNPTIADNKTANGDGTGAFTSPITGLATGTTYYLRAYATNSAGTGYGAQTVFLSQGLCPETFTDIDGNVYHAVVIGSQTWMVENLKTTRYRNGDAIRYITGNSIWIWGSMGAYCWPKNDPVKYRADYGALYNWWAFTDSRNVAPEGWHVSTFEEWGVLGDYLGGSAVAGGKMKEVGTAHWPDTNTGATNESGFTAIPAGYRSDNDGLFYAGGAACWWAKSSYDWYCYYYINSSAVPLYRGYFPSFDFGGMNDGYSIRCVKD